MKLNLEGKVVVITGGARGIGRASARIFAQEGCKLATCGRTESKLNDIRREFEADGYELYTKQVDVSDISALTQFAKDVHEHYGRIDIWINNAAVNKIQDLMDYDEAQWDAMMDVDLKAVFFGCKIAAGYMIKEGGGVIINAASFAALMANAGKAVYAAAKSGVLSLTKSFAAELAPYGIRVMAYIPGMIKTDMTVESVKRYHDKLVNDIALHRLGEPEDLAKPIVFLASDAAAYMTGSYMEVSGGKLCVQNPAYAWEKQN